MNSEPGPCALLVLTGKNISDALIGSIRKKNTISCKLWSFKIWYRLSLHQTLCRPPVVLFYLCALKKRTWGSNCVNGIDLRRCSGAGTGQCFSRHRVKLPSVKGRLGSDAICIFEMGESAFPAALTWMLPKDPVEARAKV